MVLNTDKNYMHIPTTGRAARQIACKVMNLIKVYFRFRKSAALVFSPSIPTQLIFKYAYTLDNLIHHIVHMTHFYYTWSVLQNFEKTKCAKSTCHVDNVMYQII